MQIIHMHVHEPTIFKDKKASKISISCSLAGCPLREKGQCIALNYNSTCPYGKRQVALGYTSRASRYRTWVIEAKREAAAYPQLADAEEKITFIGDYVWLPYAHMNHIDGEKVGLKFHAYAGAFIGSGVPFMPASEFTVDTIIKLVSFRPRSLMGDVIDLREQVAKFIKDLADVRPDLYQAAIERLPRIAEHVDGFNPNFTVSQLKAIGENASVLYQGRNAEFRSYDASLIMRIDSSDLPFAAAGSEHMLTFKPTPETMLTVLDDKSVIRFREKLRKRGC